MHYVFVNLKRFDVPQALGGICPTDDPVGWISEIIRGVGATGVGSRRDLGTFFFVPEALLPSATAALQSLPSEQRVNLGVGCQGVYRADIQPGGNFGAFTTNLPAAAARSLGATWAIIGHSEERKDKIELVRVGHDDLAKDAARSVPAIVDGIVNQEMLCALDRGMNVLLCMGESAAERGGGRFEEQKPRVEEALRGQVERGLVGVADALTERELVIGYEPIWAIGPGKTPPNSEYIKFVASFIKQAAREIHGIDVPVVYGGGLKEANASEIGSVQSVDGGLVALTRFTPPIGFRTDDLARIVALYSQVKGLI